MHLHINKKSGRVIKLAKREREQLAAARALLVELSTLLQFEDAEAAADGAECIGNVLGLLTVREEAAA